MEWIWQVFLLLSSCRSYAPDIGYLPIPYSEILSWSILHHVPLTPFDIRCLNELDAVWIGWSRGK